MKDGCIDCKRRVGPGPGWGRVCVSALLAVLTMGLSGCHGQETDEVISGLRSDNDRLRAEVGALRAENVVLIETVDPRWPTTVSLKRAGGNTSRLMYRRECPLGQALKGFDARSGRVVDALVPVCTPVAKMPGTRGTRTLERELAMVGGRGGRATDTMCPGQTLMIGLRGRSAEVVDALEPVCEDGKNGPRVGGEGGRDFERMCPVGWVAVGITGRQGDYLESVSLTCTDARALREQAGTLELPEHTLPASKFDLPNRAGERTAPPDDETVDPEPAMPPEAVTPTNEPTEAPAIVEPQETPPRVPGGPTF